MRGVTSGLDTNSGSFKAHVRAESSMGLESYDEPVAKWCDWWPDVEGDTPIDAESWSAAALEPTWVQAYNAAPREARRPLELLHGSPQAALNFSGSAHFGDLCSAMDRLHGTLDEEDLERAYIHTYEWRGDINPMIMPDSVANLVLHPEHDFSPHFYDTIDEEVSCTYDGDPGEYVAAAEQSFIDRPNDAISYVNNTEGAGDGYRASLGLNTSSPDFTYVESRQVTDGDFEYING